MLDIILIAVAELFQLAITWYAVDIAVRENRVRNAAIIGVAGIVAILLSAWAAYDSYISQEKLSNEVAQIRKQLSGASVGLVRMRLAPPVQELIPSKDLHVEIMFGVSEGTAKSMKCWFDAFTLPGQEGDEQNRLAVSKFRQTMAKDGPASGEDRMAGTGCYKQPPVKLSESEIAELIEGKGPATRILYAVAHTEWKNDSGADFHTDVCKWMEQPKTRILINPGWHDCSN
jgi:hypothetical protein